MRKTFSSNSMWEKRYSYSRLVVQDKRAYVAGTVAVDENGSIVGKGRPAIQAKYIFDKIEKVINEAGFVKEDVVRTRMFITDMRDSEEFGQVHGEFFKDINPAFTMVQIKTLIHQDMLVEIEMDLEKAE